MSKVSDEDVPDIKTGLFRNTCSWLAVSPVITRSKCSFSCNLRTEAFSKISSETCRLSQTATPSVIRTGLVRFSWTLKVQLVAASSSISLHEVSC